MIGMLVCLLLFTACDKTNTNKRLTPPELLPDQESVQSSTLEAPLPGEKPMEELQELPPDPVLLLELETGLPEVSFSRLIHRNADTVEIFETLGQSPLQLRFYQMASGDTVTLGRMSGAVGMVPMYWWSSDCGGELRHYDRTDKQWVTQPIAAGEYALSMAELAMEDGTSILLYLPKTYLPGENETLTYLPEQDGLLKILQIGGRWYFSLQANHPEAACVSDFTMVQGSRPMLNWEHSYCGELWKNYTMETEGKWCFDGYYWPCPYNYVPTGENCLYCCPAAYLIKSFAYAAPVHPAAENLALAMLDTMALRQNEAGYWPTTPQSEWLSADYGVSAGFYDTRFNADLVNIYCKYYEQYGGDVLLQAMERYGAYFLDFAQRTHFSASSGGWFVPDYEPFTTTPHCSLNHLLAQCMLLYRLADHLQQPELEELSDRMLQAVLDTEEAWIRDNGDLEYCVFPDGSFGMQDYPYLTYNDLYDMQQMLLTRNGAVSEELDRLMAQKRSWMDANGITGYKE